MLEVVSIFCGEGARICVGKVVGCVNFSVGKVVNFLWGKVLEFVCGEGGRMG